MSANDFEFQGLQTTAIHAGEKPDSTPRASSPNIVMSSSFVTDADTALCVTKRYSNSSEQNNF